MELGNIAKFKIELLEGFPLVNLKEEHFDIKKGYKLSAVVFNRPKGNDKKATAQVWVLSKFGDIIKETLDLEFKFSEKERINDALKPQEYKIRPEALQLGVARKITSEDIVTPWEDIIVEKVTVQKTDQKKIWKLILLVRFTSTNNKHEVNLIVDYNDYQQLNSLSLTGTIELNISPEAKVDDMDFEDEDKIEDFIVNTDITSGSPPSVPTKNIVIPAPHVRLTKLDYTPPKSVDAHEGALKVEYLNRETEQVISKWIKIYFKKTIREAAQRLIHSIEAKDIRYLPKNRKTPPVEIKAEQFRYIGNIPGLEIVDINYDYNTIGLQHRFIEVVLIVEYKTMFFKVKKIIEFLWSKQEYFDGTFRTIKHENDSIDMPSALLEPANLKAIASGDKTLQTKLINNSKISPNYPYTSIENIAISRFVEDSNLVIFVIDVKEKKGKDIIDHKFEKHAIIMQTFNEYKLNKLTAQDIQIDNNFLPIAPTTEISEQIFEIPDWCLFEAMQYAKPISSTKVMNIQLKLKTGSATVFIEKPLYFKMSMDEFHAYEQNLWEQDYLRALSPNDITIKVDLDGEPVNEISPADISGIPKGIGIKVTYNKPPKGKKTTRVLVTLTKGEAKMAFEQTLIFAKAES